MSLKQEHIDLDLLWSRLFLAEDEDSFQELRRDIILESDSIAVKLINRILKSDIPYSKDVPGLPEYQDKHCRRAA